MVVCSVFSDRLADEKDMESFVLILTDKLGLLFDQTFHNICPGKQAPVFGKCYRHLIVNSSVVVVTDKKKLSYRLENEASASYCRS